MPSTTGSLSVVIPMWSGTPRLAEMALGLCRQIREMCDELIVTEDGDYYEPLEAIADIYLHHFPRLGHARNLDSGVQQASKDFVGILDSDITITKGSLRDLCIPNKVGYGIWKEIPVPRGLIGWCFVADRNVVSKYSIGTPEFEGLGNWMAHLNEYENFVDSFEYSHPRNSSYQQMWDFKGQTLHQIQKREIDLSRHRQRILEDPLYAEKWKES